MLRIDADEAVPIAQRLLNNLSQIIPDKGLAGSAARSAIGAIYADLESLLTSEEIGPDLAAAFELVRKTGCTLAQMETVRVQTSAEAPRTLGATLFCDYAIQMCLAEEALIIGAMDFVSRQDVEALLPAVQLAFDPSVETAADTMDPMVYRGLVALQASVVNYLVQTARPLPNMVSYQFAQVLPSIVISYRLYGDASRYDEIRQENKVVHPAFCPTVGMALSR